MPTRPRLWLAEVVLANETQQISRPYRYVLVHFINYKVGAQYKDD